MPPKPKKKKAAQAPLMPMPMMGPDPSQPIADANGHYRSVAGPNPSPSMSVPPRQMPQVSVTADAIARRMASKAQGESAADQMSEEPTKKRAKKSLMELFLEMDN